MIRIFHPYDKWEDFKHGFYGGMKYPNEKSTQIYADLLKDLSRFEKCLKIITTEWKYSCEHNLTNESLNRIAYLGQASCALEHNAPSSVTMSGYNLLTKEEQEAADKLAEKYLNKWLEEHERSKEVPRD